MVEINYTFTAQSANGVADCVFFFKFLISSLLVLAFSWNLFDNRGAIDYHNAYPLTDASCCADVFFSY